MSPPPYPPEFRAEMVRLVRCGRTPEELAEQFEPVAQTIRNWAKAAGEGLTDEEREELQQLRRRVKQLEDEREILREPSVGSCFNSAVSDHPSAFPSDDRAMFFDLIEGW